MVLKIMKIYFLFIALLSFDINSTEHCKEYTYAYQSEDIRNIYDSFIAGINEIPSPVSDEFEPQFLMLDSSSKIMILERVLKECFVDKPDRHLGTVIKKIMEP